MSLFLYEIFAIIDRCTAHGSLSSQFGSVAFNDNDDDDDDDEMMTR